MVSLHDSLVSSSARKLPIRKRPDLSARKQQYQGRTYWVVKDPVGLNYYRFQEEEYAILQMLDGETSLDEIKDRFEEQIRADDFKAIQDDIKKDLKDIKDVTTDEEGKKIT